MNSERTSWVDHAKAIGIVLVVYGHVARGLFSAQIDTPLPFYLLMDKVIYSFHMPLFFFLSGLFFVQTLQKKGAGQLVLSKVDTILYPYVLWSLIQGGIEVMLSQQVNGTVTSQEVFALWWQPRAQFWFLYALFFVFAFAALVFSVVSTQRHLLVFALSVALYLFQPPHTHATIPNFIVGHLVFFCLGIVFTARLNINSFSSPLALLATATCFVVGQWLFHDFFELKLGQKNLSVLALTVVSILFVVSMAAQLAQRNLKFLAHLGASSMAIYLMHILAGSGTRVALSKLLNIDSFAVHLLVGCAVGVLAPLLAMAVFRRLKIPFLLSAPISDLLLKALSRLRKTPI